MQYKSSIQVKLIMPTSNKRILKTEAYNFVTEDIEINVRGL